MAVDKDIEDLLIKENIRYVTYSDWKIIDEYEVKEGEKVGKPREKLTSIEDIMAILKK